MNKKCVFPKMGTKKLPRKKRAKLNKDKLKDRERRLKEWRKWWS